MSDNWFFDQNFNLIEEDFFDDVNLDQSLNDIILEKDNVNEQKWDVEFQSLQPPPPMFYGDSCCAGLDENQTDSLGKSSPLNLSWSASPSRSIFLDDNPADVKDASLFQTSSPVSVLESISSCSGPTENSSSNLKLNFLVKRTRSKRKRASTFNLQSILPLLSSSSTGKGFYKSESDSHLADKTSKKKKKNLTLLSGYSEMEKSESQELVRKCLHCGITKTPQWREGPNGPKTLCNACGVRYRSGRLVPEYRPAASPTFIPSLHSNSHRKIVEMRRKAEEMRKRAELHATAAA